MSLGAVLRVSNVQNIVNVKARKATETKIIFYSQAEKKSCIPAVTIKIGFERGRVVGVGIKSLYY